MSLLQVNHIAFDNVQGPNTDSSIDAFSFHSIFPTWCQDISGKNVGGAGFSMFFPVRAMAAAHKMFPLGPSATSEEFVDVRSVLLARRSQGPQSALLTTSVQRCVKRSRDLAESRQIRKEFAFASQPASFVFWGVNWSETKLID